MQINLKIDGLAKLESSFIKFPNEMFSGLNRIVNRTAVFLEGVTKQVITGGVRMWKSPIDTGAMRRGIFAQSGNGVAYVKPSNTTPYATYVHEGTSRMKARPFFEIAAEEGKKDIEKFVSGEIDNLVNKVFK